jgi:hypothetical protein
LLHLCPTCKRKNDLSKVVRLNQEAV